MVKYNNLVSIVFAITLAVSSSAYPQAETEDLEIATLNKENPILGDVALPNEAEKEVSWENEISTKTLPTKEIPSKSNQSEEKEAHTKTLPTKGDKEGDLPGFGGMKGGIGHKPGNFTGFGSFGGMKGIGHKPGNFTGFGGMKDHGKKPGNFTGFGSFGGMKGIGHKPGNFTGFGKGAKGINGGIPHDHSDVQIPLSKGGLPSKNIEDNSKAPKSVPAKTVPADLPAKTVPADLPAKTVPADLPAKTVPVDLPAKTVPADLPAETVPADVLEADEAED